MFYVYILKSLKDQKVYIGMTSRRPQTRLVEHNKGHSKFTRMHIPWTLVYYEELTCKKCAFKREKFLKSGSGRKLVKLIIEGYLGG